MYHGLVRAPLPDDRGRQSRPIRGHSTEGETMRTLLARITLGATLVTVLTFSACFERICAGDLTGRPILERICGFTPPQA
jgi:hypothetical protein